jgi:hypothetical protein
MSVLEVPEEKVTVVFFVDWEVAEGIKLAGVARLILAICTNPACIFNRGPGGAPGSECTKKSDADKALTAGSHAERRPRSAPPSIGRVGLTIQACCNRRKFTERFAI